MSKNPTKLMGLSIDDFSSLIKHGEEIILQPARLMPFYKPGDEMSLTSIFLSGLRLIKEFRYNISQGINLKRSGYIMVFTEVEFLLFDKNRVDGLILVVKGKKIVDAVILEMKNKNNVIEESQIASYVNIAKEYRIPKLVTVSNQFVSQPTQSPISLKLPKYVNMYHLSWSYILTMAHILLSKNDNNIADEDQVEIMREIVHYFENDKSGVLGFTQMKPGWNEVVSNINTGAILKLGDESVKETVSSWLEEERDMALILSRELGLLVQSGKKQFKENLNKRIEYEKKELIANKSIESILQVDGAVSNISIRPNFDRRTIQMSVTLSAPLDRGIRSQITWIKNQIKILQNKNKELFNKIENELRIEINLKYSNSPLLIELDKLDNVYDFYKDKEIKSFSIVQIKYLGKKFENRKGIIAIIEKMLLDYYQVVVQYLKKWEKPTPKMVTKPEIIIEIPDQMNTFRNVHPAEANLPENQNQPIFEEREKVSTEKNNLSRRDVYRQNNSDSLGRK